MKKSSFESFFVQDVERRRRRLVSRLDPATGTFRGTVYTIRLLVVAYLTDHLRIQINDQKKKKEINRYFNWFGGEPKLKYLDF